MPIDSTPRLLIADDDSHVLAAYLLFLETYGYQIRTAGDGVRALKEYCTWHPQAVVLDIQMPGIDGHAVAKEIRRLQPDVATLLIAVTALSLPSDRADTMRSGFDHHLVKPVELPVLGAKLARYFGSGAAFRQAD